MSLNSLNSSQVPCQRMTTPLAPLSMVLKIKNWKLPDFQRTVTQSLETFIFSVSRTSTQRGFMETSQTTVSLSLSGN